jgi:CheY-like chemotaxis protein/predicted regulator of Ras-like GTPase activity (Roadblock/LC7/MglB family)
MSQKKQILVVDDHFEMLEFLRSMLTIANPEHDVLAVPSAEEGFMELRRTPFDLVITDVRLPGISGFELVKRIKQLRPETPIIMITAYSSAQGKEEAEQLGVFRYFRKPLDTESLLAAVKSALGEGAPGLKPAAAPATVGDTPKADKAVLVRLRTLRTDTGAAQVALVQSDGRMVIHLADAPDEEEVQLAQIAAAAMRNSLELATELRNDDPVMFQYQAGKRFDLYAANVGAHYFLLLLFRVRERRGRIGTIWVFAQRAVADLKEMLVEPPAVAPAAAAAPLVSETTAVETPTDEPEQTAEPAQEEVAHKAAHRSAQGAAQGAADEVPERQTRCRETLPTRSHRASRNRRLPRTTR